MKLLKLIEHLEEEVNAPTQWVYTSHESLLFRSCDFEEYGQGAEAKSAITLRISTDTWNGSYEIRCYLPETERPWRFLIGETGDIIIAGQMVAAALNKARQNEHD